MPKSNHFMPLPNRASVLVDAFSVAARRPQHCQSSHVHPARQPRPAWTGTALGFLAALVVTGFWFIA